MVISGLVVDTFADDTDDVVSCLNAREGVEVHEVVGTKVVVTLESETVDSSAAAAEAFQEIAGVLSVGLAYVNFEEDPSLA